MAINWEGFVFELTVASLLLIYEYCKIKKREKKGENQDPNSQKEICTFCGKKLKSKSNKNHKLDCGHKCHKACYQPQSEKECNICKIESIKDFDKIIDFPTEEKIKEKN